MFFQKGLRVIGVILTLSLSGCAYEMQIQQGVAVTPTTLAQLKPGQTQAQVSYLLGTPNLTDPYDPNTWYYVYTDKQDSAPLVQHQVIIHFNDAGQLTSYQQD